MPKPRVVLGLSLQGWSALAQEFLGLGIKGLWGIREWWASKGGSSPWSAFMTCCNLCKECYHKRRHSLCDILLVAGGSATSHPRKNLSRWCSKRCIVHDDVCRQTWCVRVFPLSSSVCLYRYLSICTFPPSLYLSLLLLLLLLLLPVSSSSSSSSYSFSSCCSFSSSSFSSCRILLFFSSVRFIFTPPFRRGK